MMVMLNNVNQELEWEILLCSFLPHSLLMEVGDLLYLLPQCIMGCFFSVSFHR